LLALAVVCAFSGLSRASGAPLSFGGLESEQRNQAIASVPLDSLTEEAKAKIVGVVSRPSIYRRMPITVVNSAPDLYLFLVRHPEVVVNMWELMGVTKVTVDRTGPYSFDATDGAGTSCAVELLYGDRNIHVLYSEGQYEGSLLRNLIRGRCVLVLKSEFSQSEDGAVQVTNRLDMFVRFENVGAELLARTIHPLVGRSADHNFIESTKFLGQVSEAAATKLDRLHRFTKKLTRIDNNVRDQFDEATSAASTRAARRGSPRHARSRATITDSDIDNARVSNSRR
jgi:hypothetical protein